MNAKTIIALQVEKNGHVFTFQMPVGVNYGEAYDAAFCILEDILSLSQQVLDSKRREQKEEEGISQE